MKDMVFGLNFGILGFLYIVGLYVIGGGVVKLFGFKGVILIKII